MGVRRWLMVDKRRRHAKEIGVDCGVLSGRDWHVALGWCTGGDGVAEKRDGRRRSAGADVEEEGECEDGKNDWGVHGEYGAIAECCGTVEEYCNRKGGRRRSRRRREISACSPRNKTRKKQFDRRCTATREVEQGKNN